MRVEVVAPAKVNLSLRVTGKRPDGYHELLSIMAPVSLFDRLAVERLPRGGLIEVDSSGSPFVTGGEGNISHRASRFFFEETGASGGVRINVEKNIPVGAGLGGGSSDAASTIMALELLFGVKLSADARKRAGFSVGADVPFFFNQGPARVGGIGELVEPLPDVAKLWLVLVHPGVFLSTATVFSRFNIGLTRTGRPNTIACFDFQGIIEGMENDLEASARELEPQIGLAMEALNGAGALSSMMTGSGSAAFGIFKNAEDAKAAASAIQAGATGDWRVEAVHTLTGPGDYPEVKKFWGVGKR